MLVDAAIEISPKRLRFCDAYLLHGNISRAAEEAGYSAASARTSGRRLLQMDAVKDYIASRRAPVEAKSVDLQSKVLEEIKTLAFANIEDLTSLNSEGQRDVDFSSATREQLAAVTKISNKKRSIYNSKGELVAVEEQRGFTLADKYRGLELLGRYTGMFKAEEQRVVVDVADRLLTARQRLLSGPSEDDGGEQ